MSWQLASFAIVLGSLGAAFWWYERSHPPAKLVAVIATLAALAALGRDAFAAVPDVKPITAIVLVSGLAFGVRPGFAIGAISALASNILLGQGPWTPWQMLGWGLVGVFGALLRRPLGERPPALAIGLACALGAEMFNLLLDVYTWTGTGDHTFAGYGVVVGGALAFDLTHVGASFAFGFAFGPALLRMLVRVRARLQVTWRDAHAARPAGVARLLGGPPAAMLLLLCVPLIALGLTACADASSSTTAGAPPARDARVAIARELAYLKAAQNPDGGFGVAPGQPSSELYSAWAAIGLAAAGRDPVSLRKGGHSVLDALRGEAASLHGAGDLERTILALRACGAPVRSLPGGDPVQRLLGFRAGDGSFSHLSNLTAFGILALRAAGYGPGAAPVGAAARWLALQQEADGGFSYAARGGGSDVDDTAAVLQALHAAGTRYRRELARGVAFLRRAQNPDGGFPQQRGGPSNAQSTAWAIQGLAAAGVDAGRVSRQGSRSPVAYIETLLAPDGSVRYSRTGAQTPVWVTAQALTGIAQRPLPVAPPGG
ncbi:MAG TPA: prenyltransferase/squalene oxidase repeat-containing protein [Solirubrobacteraceae bacterium]|nr:prenyltransferase/squalene oxidase repeat-containing protein [Solirubrobacteraceae bacterium]